MIEILQVGCSPGVVPSPKWQYELRKITSKQVFNIRVFCLNYAEISSHYAINTGPLKCRICVQDKKKTLSDIAHCQMMDLPCFVIYIIVSILRKNGEIVKILWTYWLGRFLPINANKVIVSARR